MDVGAVRLDHHPKATRRTRQIGRRRAAVELGFHRTIDERFGEAAEELVGLPGVRLNRDQPDSATAFAGLCADGIEQGRRRRCRCS